MPPSLVSSLAFLLMAFHLCSSSSSSAPIDARGAAGGGEQQAMQALLVRTLHAAVALDEGSKELARR